MKLYSPKQPSKLDEILLGYAVDSLSINEDLVLQQDEAKLEAAHNTNLSEAKAQISALIDEEAVKVLEEFRVYFRDEADTDDVFKALTDFAEQRKRKEELL